MNNSSFPEIHGHRGCRGLRPENTLPAFLHALRLGVDVIELDVVISADNQVVVSHEPWMAASICQTPTGQPIESGSQTQHNLYRLPYEAIRRYNCGLAHPAYPEQVLEPTYKPLLSEVISALDNLAFTLGKPPVRLSVELKCWPTGDGIFHPDPAHFLARVLTELQAAAALARTTLLCFDKRILQLARLQLPSVPLCLLVEDERPLADHLAELGFQPHVYGPDFRLLTPGLIQQLQQLQLEYVPWTVNTPTDLRWVMSFRPKGITTDFPDRLLALRNS